MTRGLGARRSHPAKLARRVSVMLHPAVAAAAASLPASVDLTPYLPQRLDQGATSSCTAHSAAGAIVTAFAAASAPLGWTPSPREGYAATRARERSMSTATSSTLPPLADQGAELADVWAIAAEYGAMPMGALAPDGRYSDVTPDNVNNEPDLGGLETSGQRLILGPYAIDPSTATASDQMAAVLAAKMPIHFAAFVDSAFENLGPGDVAGAPNQSDPNGGGHALFFAGYRTNAAGAREWLVVNSWGASWCDNGMCWASEAFRAACWEAWPMAIARGG